MKLNNMDLNKLAVFIEVGRLGGISKAAQVLGLTPSAVSQSIKSLEESLEARLFDRIGKNFTLSHQGQTLFEGLLLYQDKLQETLARLQGSRRRVRGMIRLGVFYGFSNGALADCMLQMHREYPDIEVDVLFASPSDLDRLLQEKRLDFTINLFLADKSHGLVETELFADELWLVSSQKPPSRSLSFEELRKAPFIDYYRKGHLIAAWIEHHFGKKVRDVRIVMHAAHSELVVQLILRAVGTGVVASSIARPYVEAGKLFVIRGSRKQLPSQIWLKRAAQGLDGDSAKMAFESHVKSYFAKEGVAKPRSGGDRAKS